MTTATRVCTARRSRQSSPRRSSANPNSISAVPPASRVQSRGDCCSKPGTCGRDELGQTHNAARQHSTSSSWPAASGTTMPSQMASPPLVGMGAAWTLRGRGGPPVPSAARTSESARPPPSRPPGSESWPPAPVGSSLARSWLRCLPLALVQKIAALREELLIVLAAIIGEGVLVMPPAVMLVMERHFGVDAAARDRCDGRSPWSRPTPVWPG